MNTWKELRIAVVDAMAKDGHTCIKGRETSCGHMGKCVGHPGWVYSNAARYGIEKPAFIGDAK